MFALLCVRVCVCPMFALLCVCVSYVPSFVYACVSRVLSTVRVFVWPALCVCVSCLASLVCVCVLCLCPRVCALCPLLCGVDNAEALLRAVEEVEAATASILAFGTAFCVYVSAPHMSVCVYSGRSQSQRDYGGTGEKDSA